MLYITPLAHLRSWESFVAVMLGPLPSVQPSLSPVLVFSLLTLAKRRSEGAGYWLDYLCPCKRGESRLSTQSF
jgi:hypothetical protein